ncbi:hypothetical protein [Dactylosporangium sp. CA-139066]|uniref:hypothetical protein n=1 Tax=Dactylosporangium sp. CA-139066 TaxID=3239930 RepID=UPI003D8F2983
MMALKGTPAERRQQKADQRRANEIAFHRQAGIAAQTGHEKVIAATQAAKAASKGLTDGAARELALHIVQLVERFDVAENRRRP